jgi:hypothetical protein
VVFDRVWFVRAELEARDAVKDEEILPIDLQPVEEGSNFVARYTGNGRAFERGTCCIVGEGSPRGKCIIMDAKHLWTQ